jgi:ribonuclease BN (tRNA processing enzyme)
MNRTGKMFVILLMVFTCNPTHGQDVSATQVVLLGTGTPLPDPERAGPSIAVVVNGAPYLVDAGTGLVRRAAAARDKGVVALRPVNLKIAFLTHLHSDHTLGLPDLMITPWIMGRKEPLELYGPRGTRRMVNHILGAYEIDRKIRIRGLEHSNNTGWQVNVHEIQPGLVFKDANVTVIAFLVRHGNVGAFGYRFITPDRTIVISGDTSPTDAIAQNCHSCDILIHEAYTKASFDLVPPSWQQYRLAYHTSAQELGATATKAKPKLLILFHRGNAGCDQAGTQSCREAGSEEQLLNEVRQSYAGKVVAGHDLEIY